MSGRSDLERRPEHRIHFLLPPLIAAYVMLGLAILGSDFVLMHPLHGGVIYGFACIIVFEIALLANIFGRRRAVTMLGLLQSGHCINCGYELRGNTERCSGCGKPVPA